MNAKSKNITIIALLVLFSILPAITVISFVKFIKAVPESLSLINSSSFFYNSMFFISLLFLSFFIYVFSISTIIKFKYSISNEIFYILLFLIFSLFLNLKSVMFNFDILNLPSIYYMYSAKTLLGTLIISGLYLISASLFSSEISYKNFELIFIIIFAFVVIFMINIPIDTNTIGLKIIPHSPIQELIYIAYAMLIVTSSLFFFFSNKIVILKDKFIIGASILIDGIAVATIFFIEAFFINIPVIIFMIIASYYLLKRLHSIYLWG